jgi:nitroreductase
MATRWRSFNPNPPLRWQHAISKCHRGFSDIISFKNLSTGYNIQKNPDPNEGVEDMVEFIFQRRSIRRFTAEPVEEAKVKTLLEAAMAAPSSNNRRPWHYVVTHDRGTLNRLGEAHPYGKMLYQATLAVAVCADPGISPVMWVQDCSAATENILLAASSLGLGACWLGCHPYEDRTGAVRQILEIPQHIEVLSLLAIGHPGEKKQPRTQFDGSRVHREKW